MSQFDVNAYGRMLTEEPRITAYTASIRAAVRPGDVVLELGTGTGLMALLACQCGARRVYALEPSEAIHIAKQAARDNGFADRIVFLRAFSTTVDLPERSDILISDMRGSSPCYSSHLADLMDTRERLLQPDARWICQTDTLYAAAVEGPEQADRFAVQWDGSRWGLDLRASLPYARNTMTLRAPKPDNLLTEGRSWAQIRYPALTTPHVRGVTVLTATRGGTAHGLLVWFAAELFGGFRYTNAPDQPTSIYRQIFLPWEHSVELQPGDRVETRLAAVYAESAYTWNWATTVRREGCAKPVASFHQSTFKGRIFDPALLTQFSGDFAPQLSAAGEEVRFVLGRIDGHATQATLAAALRTEFPQRYSTDEEAMARIHQIRRAFAQ